MTPLMRDSQPSTLEDEARYLYRNLFGKEAPDEISLSYARAMEELFPDELGRQRVDVARIIKRRLDPEAVEFYLRFKTGAPNALTQRIHILFYLAELRSEQSAVFELERPKRFRAYSALLGAGLGTGYKLVKGMFQVTRHGLRQTDHNAA